MEEKSNPGPKVSLPAQNEGSTPDEKLGVNQRKKKNKSNGAIDVSPCVNIM